MRPFGEDYLGWLMVGAFVTPLVMAMSAVMVGDDQNYDGMECFNAVVNLNGVDRSVKVCGEMLTLGEFDGILNSQ